MRSAYNETWLRNLHFVKESKRWLKSGYISREQATAIFAAYPSHFYHPNVMIRLLLFIAALIAIGGVTGLLGLMVADSSESTLSYLVLFYGIISFVFLDKFFLRNANHYKSGVSEAILYHALSFTIGGLGWIMEMEVVPFTLACLIVFSFAAYRYLDLISTACAMLALAYLIFYLLYQAGGIWQQIIPIVFIILFTPLYFVIKRTRQHSNLELWEDALIVLECIALLLIYAAGNYLVVRELSIELMDLSLEEGQDIPLAFVFYGLTVIIPALYLYFGISKKDLVLLRVSLFAFAFSVFTFKYYYSTGHHEITFTVSGAFLLLVSIWLLRYLKTPRNGFTRENVMTEKWAGSNLQAFIISQTLGGNKMTSDATTQPGGGTSGGGGSTDSF
jgi:hypothetical protein